MAGRGDNSKAKAGGGVDTEPLRRAITGCVRSIAGDPQVEVAFANDRPGIAGERIRLPGRVGEIEVLLPIDAKTNYDYFLPSANIAFDLSQEVKLRLAAYRAIARSGIESFGAGIRLNPSAGTGLDNIIFDATTGKRL